MRRLKAAGRYIFELVAELTANGFDMAAINIGRRRPKGSLFMGRRKKPRTIDLRRRHKWTNWVAWVRQVTNPLASRFTPSL
jgi:hypothetical protein